MAKRFRREICHARIIIKILYHSICCRWKFDYLYEDREAFVCRVGKLISCVGGKGFICFPLSSTLWKGKRSTKRYIWNLDSLGSPELGHRDDFLPCGLHSSRNFSSRLSSKKTFIFAISSAVSELRVSLTTKVSSAPQAISLKVEKVSHSNCLRGERKQEFLIGIRTKVWDFKF